MGVWEHKYGSNKNNNVDLGILSPSIYLRKLVVSMCAPLHLKHSEAWVGITDKLIGYVKKRPLEAYTLLFYKMTLHQHLWWSSNSEVLPYDSQVTTWN